MEKQQLFKILKRPLITEKANDLKDDFNQYAFEVQMDSNKVEIRHAVETLFGVRVTDVRTSIVRGKQKRVGRNVGKRANWKKAMVTLRDGDMIDFFEGV